MANEKPCIYKHTCGWDICMKSDCPEYVPKTKGRKWFEEEEEEDDVQLPTNEVSSIGLSSCVAS